MKKNKLTFLIAASFLALGAMVGCDSNEPSEESKNNGATSDITTSQLINPSSDGGNTQSSDGGNSNSNTSQGGGNTSQGGDNTSQGGGNTDKTDWTQDEKTTMSSHLHGLILPFVNMDVGVSYRQSSDVVKIESQANMASDFLASYAAKYSEEDGWVGGDISNELEVYPGNAYGYQKAVTENGKKYYVSVFMTGLQYTSGSEQVNFSKDGRFYLEASDPYEYEYPAAFIGQWLGQQFSTSIVPPSFEAEYYNLDSEGVLIGGSQRNLEDSYKTALLATGNFTVDSTRNDDGYLVARPIDGSYVLWFKYDSNSKAMILQVVENTGWNAAKINAFFAKYGKTPYDIPAFSDENVTFKFEEDEMQPAGYERATITIDRVTTQKVQAYVNSLKTAGYILIDDVVVDSNYQWYTSAHILTNDGVYALDLTYYPTSSPKRLEITINLFVDTSRVKAWPAAQLAAMAQATQDVIPEFTDNNNGFYAADQGVTIYVDDNREEAARDAYVAILTAAKYTLIGGHYVSEHNEIDIEIECNHGKWPGQIYLIVKPYAAPAATPWPVDSIASAIAKFYNADSITDTIPGLNVDNATSCTVSDNYVNELRIDINGLASSKDAYKQVFKDNGWVEDVYYNYDYTLKGGLVSPSRQLVACFDTVGNDLSIYVKPYYQPSLTVAGLGGNWNYNQSLVFFESADVDEEIARGEYVKQYKAEFDVDANDEFKVSNGVDWYGFNALEANDKFVVGEGDKDPNIKALEKGSVTLYFKIKENNVVSIYIAFEADSSGSGSGEQPQLEPWPEEELLTYFGENTFTAIPEIKIDGASYHVEGTDEFYGIKVFYITVTVEDAKSKMDDAIEELKSSFSYAYDDSAEGYVSSNEGLPVYAFVEGDNETFGIAIAYFPEAEPAYKVVGLGDDWGFENGLELEPVENLGEDYSAQYTVDFNVEIGDSFKVTDSNLWYGFDKLVDNAAFGTAGDENIVAKQQGAVTLHFNIRENGEIQIVIEFTPDKDQPTELTYKLVSSDNWENLIAANAKFYAWVWGGEYGAGQWIELSVDETNHCFYLENIDVNATGFKIVRMSPEAEPSFDTAWNKSASDISFPEVGLTISFTIL